MNRDFKKPMAIRETQVQMTLPLPPEREVPPMMVAVRAIIRGLMPFSPIVMDAAPE